MTLFLLAAMDDKARAVGDQLNFSQAVRGTGTAADGGAQPSPHSPPDPAWQQPTAGGSGNRVSAIPQAQPDALGMDGGLRRMHSTSPDADAYRRPPPRTISAPGALPPANGARNGRAKEPKDGKDGKDGGSRGVTIKNAARYKTELCRAFTEKGVCKYGEKCQVLAPTGSERKT